MKYLVPFLSLLLLTSLVRSQETVTVQIQPSLGLPDTKRFIVNQMALLTSGPILGPASEKCGLPSKSIAASLKLQRIQESDLLTISSFHDDKTKRQLIVKAVLDSYLAHRKRLDTEVSGEELKTLEKQIVAVSDITQETRKTLAGLIQSYGIPYFDGNSPSPMGATEEQMYQDAQKKLTQFKNQSEQIEIQIKKMDSLESPELTDFNAEIDPDLVQVTLYSARYRTAIDDRLDLIATGLGESHPKIKALDAKASEALKKAQKEIVSIKAVLKTKLELVNRQVEKMTEMVESRNDDAKALALIQQKYDLAKKAYEEAREELRDLKRQQEELQATLKNTRHLIIHGWE